MKTSKNECEPAGYESRLQATTIATTTIKKCGYSQRLWKYCAWQTFTRNFYLCDDRIYACIQHRQKVSELKCSMEHLLSHLYIFYWWLSEGSNRVRWTHFTINAECMKTFYRTLFADIVCVDMLFEVLFPLFIEFAVKLSNHENAWTKKN